MFDVLIIGGGLSGTLAATLLARNGVTVALLDRSRTVRSGFRAEQLVGGQVEAMRQLGVLDGLVRGIVPVDHAIGVRSGRIVGGVDEVHYGFRYQDLVTRAREAMPASVTFIADRVTDLQTGCDHQTAALASGGTIDARLVIIATGQERALVQQIGIGRRMIREGHSLTIGLDLDAESRPRSRLPLVTCYPANIRQRIDYLAAFPLGPITRLNLFTYCDLQDPWIGTFRHAPRAALLEAFPGIERFLGPLTFAGPPQMRLTDLWMASGCVRNGLVMIGDAYQTTCPATGMGISRLLLDVERLCHEHAPRWLSRDGVAAEQITTFYDDPAKLALDRAAMDAAEYHRAAATESGLRWSLRRRQVAARQRIGGLFGGPTWLTAGFTFARRSKQPRGGPAGHPVGVGMPVGRSPDAPAGPDAPASDARHPADSSHVHSEYQAVVGPETGVGEQVERPFGG